MKKVEFILNRQFVTYRIEKAFPNDEKFRIIIDKEGSPTGSVKSADGESPREFDTHEEAEAYILKYATMSLNGGRIKSFTAF